jgi:hypothetical protein
MADYLKMDYINSLPQLYVELSTGLWPVFDMDAETGCLRIDVCGRLQVSHLFNVICFIDDDGNRYEPEDFITEECK